MLRSTIPSLYQRILVSYLHLQKSHPHQQQLLNTLLHPRQLQIVNSYDSVRFYSEPGRRPNFFSQFMENLKQEMSKNKEMKENLKKFREEADKLEHSEALQKAREKFHTVESEASKSSEVLKEHLETLKGKVHDALEEAGKSEIAKKAGHITGELGKSAREAAQSISKGSQQIGKSGAFQSLSRTAGAVKEELNQGGMNANVYQAPTKLRKRIATLDDQDSKTFSPNTEAMGVELHKDSRFFESWQNFKDNNPYVHKVLHWKTKYDESDNAIIRASRVLTEKVSDVMGGLFQKTELSATLTEICKIDPNFNRIQFLKDCERDIIPNILEAMVRGDLDILKDWCYEAPFNVLALPIRQAQSLRYHFDSKVLDIEGVDIAMGKVMDQGPVLVITFSTQQILCLRDSKNNVVEGDPEKVLRVNYVWVLCRDSAELNPKAAWRLLDISASSSEQFI